MEERVGSVARAESREREAGGLLVERERELAVLEDALERARAGVGGSVMVEGAAGLGKSRLLDEIAARASMRGIAVLRARAHETERAFQFALALELFERMLASIGIADRERLWQGAAGLARPLLSGQDISYDEQRAASPFSRLHGLYWLAVNFTTWHGALVVCVDDVHWGDEASVRFLLYLASRLDELPIALVVAARPSAGEREGEALGSLRTMAPRRLELRALAVEGVTTVVRSSLPGAGPGFCAACAEVTQGNPFYIHEVLLALAEERVAPTDASSARLRELGAASVGQAALFRMVRLGSDAVALGRALAVLGDGSSLQRVGTLAQLEFETASAAADALAGAEVFAPGEPLAFAHPLIRESIYAEIPPGQQGLAHLRAARLLADQGAAVEEVAGQLLSAATRSDGWVVAALVAAARRARIQLAPESAVSYLQRALEEPPPAELRGDVLVELGDAEAALGSERATDRFSAALQLESEPRKRARIQRLRGRALAGIGQSRAAAEALESAIDELGEDDRDLTHALLADYLSTAVFEAGMRQRAFARAAPLLERPPDGSTPAERSLLAALTMRSAQEAEPVKRTVELAERAWSDGALLADEGPEAPGWLMIDWALELAEDYERATMVTTAAIDAARRVGSVQAFANASYFHGDASYRQGHLVEAEADAEQALEAGRSGWRRYLAAAHVLKANVLIERGELVAADAALDAAEEQGDSAMLEVPWRLHALGRLELARSHPREALERFMEAGDWLSQRLSVERTVLPWRADAAHAAIALGENQLAKELIEPAAALGERVGLRALHGRALRALGLIEGGKRGLSLLGRAVESLERSQESLQLAYALADLGAALRRAGRRVDSRPPLRHALELAHQLEALPLARRASEELAATGARARRELVGGLDSLTASERRVARLAAQGHTNPEIAQALFVTPKTIEYHLRHVYQKLDIPGRPGLRDALGAPDHASPAGASKD